MANPVKGEISFEASGKEYIFKFGTNAQAIIESRVGMTTSQFLQSKGENWGAADLRLIFYAGLFGKHQMSETEVGDLIDELGADRCSEIFVKAVNAAAARHNKGNGGADPMQPNLTPVRQIGTDF